MSIVERLAFDLNGKAKRIINNNVKMSFGKESDR